MQKEHSISTCND